MRVFIEIPPGVSVKIFKQPLNRQKLIGGFRGAKVTVIAPAGFIVISQNTGTIIYQCHAVFVAVFTTR